MTNSIITKTNIETYIDEDGNQKQTIQESTKKIERNGEPDYIKLYTNMWCEFNQIPNQWRDLFLELICRMSYADSSHSDSSQIVATGGLNRESICRVLGWKKNMYQKGLKALCDCGAIRKRMNGYYQVNPSYAGRGEWKFNPRLQRGGIEDLKATFDFKTRDVKLDIIWADDGQDNSFNAFYRDGLHVSADDSTVIKSREVANL